jgi:plastocyanin domain-containing protein
MTRAASFKQADATRAIKAAVKAGMKPSECVIDSAGTIRLVFGSDTPSPSKTNPMDRILPR